MSMSNVEGSAGQETRERREGQQPQTEQGKQPQAEQGQRREGEGQQHPQGSQPQRREEEGQQQRQAQRPQASQELAEPRRQGRGGEDAGEQAQRRGDEPQVLGARPLSSGDDFVLESPRLKVDELNLEMHGNAGERIDVSTKGVESEVYMRANLGNALGIVEAARTETPRATEDEARRHERRGETSPAIRDDVQRALEAAKSAYERIGAPDLRDELQGAFNTVRHAVQEIVSDSGDEARREHRREAREQQGNERSQEGGGDGGAHPSRDRALRVARSQGAAAVAGALAGYAGSKSHLPTRSQEKREHRSGRMRSATGDFVDRATDVSGGIAKAVLQRIG